MNFAWRKPRLGLVFVAVFHGYDARDVAAFFFVFFQERLVTVVGDIFAVIAGIDIVQRILFRIIRLVFGFRRAVGFRRLAGRFFVGWRGNGPGGQFIDGAADWANDRITVLIIEPCIAFGALAGALRPARLLGGHAGDLRISEI